MWLQLRVVIVSAGKEHSDGELIPDSSTFDHPLEQLPVIHCRSRAQPQFFRLAQADCWVGCPHNSRI